MALLSFFLFVFVCFCVSVFLMPQTSVLACIYVFNFLVVVNQWLIINVLRRSMIIDCIYTCLSYSGRARILKKNGGGVANLHTHADS